MAPKEPPAWTEIPGLRERRYGASRLDFGVYVPEMNRGGVPRGPWINDYNCQLRATIGRLLTGEHGDDFWWSLGEPEASAKAGEALRGVGFAWLDQFASAQDILDEFDRLGSIEIGASPAGALDIADLCRARGDSGRERRVLEEYVAHPVLASHADYLSDYLRGNGHADLVARIITSPS